MKNKQFTAMYSAIALVTAFLFAGVASAGNGNGMELEVKGEETVSFCDKYPKLCVLTTRGGGNGSGNEPPNKND